MAHDIDEVVNAILSHVPQDGSTIGNGSLLQAVGKALGTEVSQDAYDAARDTLVEQGLLAKGRGRGGSVRRVAESPGVLTLKPTEIPAGADTPTPKQAGLTLAQALKEAGTKGAVRKKDDDAKVIAYRHKHTRTNNPDVGVVTPDNDPEQPKTPWAYDPHIDPALQFDIGRAEIENLIDDALASDDESVMRAALEQLKQQAAPYLNWTGKAERTSFEVDTVSLHVHERIDPATILGAIQKRIKREKGEHGGTADMFRPWFEEPLPLREAVDFYKHDRGWSNRLVAGDSLLVMNSLLQKESMAGQVQMIYIDPPYGIRYGSNFQPFVNKRDVKDRKDEDLTQEPEMIKAFRDTWELGVHSYLTYLRDRLLVARELLNESGSIFVQIGDENIHHVRELMDEIFGAENFFAQINFKSMGQLGQSGLASTYDYLLWYAKNVKSIKFRPLYRTQEFDGDPEYRFLDKGGCYKQVGKEDLPSDFSGVFRRSTLTSSGYTESCMFKLDLFGEEFDPFSNKSWRTNSTGMDRLKKANRLFSLGTNVYFKRFATDSNLIAYENSWSDPPAAAARTYVVETAVKFVERCLLMTTDPGDLVFDPTCGSGTTAFVAEKWGRRWVTCDTSRVAVTLAKQRLMTANYDYYELKYPHEGLKAGFIYKTSPRIALKSIATNPEIDEVWERMHPSVEQALGKLNSALRSTGAKFTVADGGRKSETLDFGKGASLQEWEVPFDFPSGWNADAREPFDAFHAARQAMQKTMDDAIASFADQEILYDQPVVSKDKLRITGPFTVEAVPFPTVLSLDETQAAPEPDTAIARSGESLRQHSWRDELLKTGIRGKGGQILKFAELETLPDTKYLHCSGHLADTGERLVVSFGPAHAALEQRQVELAMREASDLFPRPKMIVFCAFTFDPEAAKDIDATKGVTALKAQMNTDLLTDDLKKNRSSNQSFWLMGQPDVDVRRRKDGRWEVEVNGFDYFDTTSGELKSGGKKNIAAWSLDTDYDERSLFPQQVFFPMAGAKDGWNKLKRDIKAELDESKLGKLHGTVSLPFEAGDNRKVAVKIVDDRGIESLKVVSLDD